MQKFTHNRHDIQHQQDEDHRMALYLQKHMDRIYDVQDKKPTKLNNPMLASYKDRYKTLVKELSESRPFFKLGKDSRGQIWECAICLGSGPDLGPGGPYHIPGCIWKRAWALFNNDLADCKKFAQKIARGIAKRDHLTDEIKYYQQYEDRRMMASNLEKSIKRIEDIDDKEFLDSVVKTGIYDKNGKLTKHYESLPKVEKKLRIIPARASEIKKDLNLDKSERKHVKKATKQMKTKKVPIRIPAILKEVERELKADWRYHDWDRDAVLTIEKLAKELRKTLENQAKKKK